jgi:hypothetical protein
VDKAAFWKVVDASRRASDGDPDAQIDELCKILGELPADEIVEFDRIFSEYHERAYTWDLWGAAYIIGGGCSDDGFMDFRGWLISRGEKAYEAALSDPESLTKVVKDDDGECQIEGFQYVASRAWEAKTGLGSDAFPRHSIERLDDPVGNRWEEDELDERFPRLAKRFN